MTSAFFQPGAQFFSGASSGGGGGGGGVVLGTSWYPLLPLQIPDIADFTLTSAAVGTTTVTGDAFGIVINQPPAGAQQVRYVYQAPPSTPYTVTVALEFLAIANLAGIAFRDGGTGRLLGFAAGNDFAVYRYRVFRYTNLTTLSATPAEFRHTPIERSTVMRMTDDGVNLTFFVSPNGFDWVQMYTETRATWCANPTQIGFYSNNGATGADPNATVRCVSWEAA